MASYVYRDRLPISGWRVHRGDLTGAEDPSLDDSGWEEFRRLAVQGPVRDLVAMAPAVAQTLIHRRGRAGRRLTRRELDVLRLIAQGHNNAGISRRLTINEKSVENVIRALYRVLGVSKEGTTHPRVTAALSYLDGAGART